MRKRKARRNRRKDTIRKEGKETINSERGRREGRGEKMQCEKREKGENNSEEGRR